MKKSLFKKAPNLGYADKEERKSRYTKKRLRAFLKKELDMFDVDEIVEGLCDDTFSPQKFNDDLISPL